MLPMNYALDVRALTNQISDSQLEQLCRENPDRRFEINAEGKLIVMQPTGSLTGEKNSSLLGQIWYWNSRSKLGKVFDSSTGFRLANGALRSPDVSWIALERWNSLNDKLQRGFAPIDPDFVIELMSPTDTLKDTQAKMREYTSCGVKLGWLVDPDTKRVEVYRLGQEPEILSNPKSLSGEDLLPELVVDLTEIL